VARITGTSHEDQYTLVIMFRSVLLRMKNVSDKSCRKNQNTQCMFSNFIFENRLLKRKCGKIFYSQTGHRWKYVACL